MSSSSHKVFTLQEAQRMLPVLEQLLRTAMQAHQRGHEIDQEFQALIARILVSGGVQLDPIRSGRLRSEREQCQQCAHDAVREIGASGVQVKDLELGLLDFPARLRGKSVLLCWKLGEAGIGHYHGPQEGFAHRRPLDPAFFAHENPRHLQ